MSRNRYIELIEKGKENRTPLEEKEYLFLDAACTLKGLRDLAKAMGNKHPEENFLVKDALERYEKAKKEYECAKNASEA